MFLKKFGFNLANFRNPIKLPIQISNGGPINEIFLLRLVPKFFKKTKPSKIRPKPRNSNIYKALIPTKVSSLACQICSLNDVLAQVITCKYEKIWIVSF